MLRMCASPLLLLSLLVSPAFAQAPARDKAEASASKPATVVNLNTATAAELEQLPGIGAKVAARIVEYRTKKGPFKKIEELMNVQGIGEKSFLKLRSQLTVGGASASPAQQQ
ncbi:MAG: helix-hairpin-helix domain-containing protein [Vicinamibacterales bacterium]